jgi:integrase
VNQVSVIAKTVLPVFLEQLPAINRVSLMLERKGKTKETIQTYEKALKSLAKRGNLNNPDEVELIISRYTNDNEEPASNVWKTQLVTAYTHYCKTHNITWEDPPKYKRVYKSIQPPTKEKQQMLISTARGTLSLKLGISVETGLRPCEVTGNPKGLKVKDIHPDTRTITPYSAKGCNPRPPIKISHELTTRLQTYIIKHKLKPDDRLFQQSSRSYSINYIHMRNRLAEKLQDPSIQSIRLYDLRHAYITNLLRKTQNAEIVRQKVGHKRLDTTQRYLHLTNLEDGEYIVESTTDQKRADELLEQGFNYCLTTPDGYMKFRKPK